MSYIEQILNSNLTQEQKEALLGQYANEIINNKEKTFEEKRQELIKKNNEQASMTRERLKAYEEKSYKEEEQKKREKELEDKLEFIIKEEEKKGRKLNKENLKELTGYEIEAIYNNITEGREEIVVQTKNNTKEKEKLQNNNSETSRKSSVTGEQENNGASEEKNNIQPGPKLANNKFPYDDSTKNSFDDKVDEEKEPQNNDSPKVDTTPEPKKKVTAITKAKDWLKSKVNNLKMKRYNNKLAKMTAIQGQEKTGSLSSDDIQRIFNQASEAPTSQDSHITEKDVQHLFDQASDVNAKPEGSYMSEKDIYDAMESAQKMR